MGEGRETKTTWVSDLLLEENTAPDDRVASQQHRVLGTGMWGRMVWKTRERGMPSWSSVDRRFA